MSTNRENVVWQAADGTWSRGFYAFDYVREDAEDFDPEWDVDYDFTRFSWQVTGLASEDAAVEAWQGSNPGGWSRYDRASAPGRCDELDAMAAAGAAECAAFLRSIRRR